METSNAVNKQKNICVPSVDMKIFFNNYNLEMSNFKFSNEHCLRRAKNGAELFSSIMQTETTQLKYNYKHIENIVEPALKKFLQNHKNLNYFVLASKIIIDDCSKQSGSIHVPMNELQSFFGYIIYKVVPLELMGSSRNKKILARSVNIFLKVKRNEYLDLSLILKKLHISDIQWIKHISENRDKYLIISIFLKWFFNDYICEIIKQQFYVTFPYGIVAHNVFIRHSDWNCEKRKLMRKFQDITSTAILFVNTKDLPSMRFRWIKGKMQPLLVSQCSKDRKPDISKLNSFLYQLFLTNYPKAIRQNFETLWTNLRKRLNTQSGSVRNDVYLITADIKDAFGSVKQEKLYGIIKGFCDILSNKLLLQRFQSIKRKRNKKYVEYFIHKSLALPNKIKTDYQALGKGRFFCVSYILTLLKEVIFSNKFQIGNKVYTMRQGLLRGFVLSSILCQIYYQEMNHSKLTYFMMHGILYQHVDDYIYITRSKEAACLFLRFIQHGCKEYNCHFNKRKTTTNFDPETMLFNNEYITYLGWRINGTSLEVEPKYVAALKPTKVIANVQGVEPSFKNVLCSSWSVLSLKLHRIVLSPTVNSYTTILKVLELASLKVADLHLIMIKRFSDSSCFHTTVMEGIRTSNDSIMRRVISFQTEAVPTHVKSQMYYIIWTSYKKVFSNNPKIYKCFKRSFIYEINRIRRRLCF